MYVLNYRRDKTNASTCNKNRKTKTTKTTKNDKLWMCLESAFCVSQTKLSLSIIAPGKYKPIVSDSKCVHLSTGYLFNRPSFKRVNTSCEVK